MKIGKGIQEKMQAELLNVHVDWLNATRKIGQDERAMWARSPRNFVALIQKTIDDPQFLVVVSTANWIRGSLRQGGGMSLKEQPIAYLDLASRTMRALEDANIMTVGDLYVMACKDQLRKIRGLGSMYCLMDIADCLRRAGLPVVKINQTEKK